MGILNTTQRLLPAIIVGAALCVLPQTSSAGIAVSITVAPPVLPVYTQPLCPADGYLWTPGYWAWGPAGYYWVPGVWVQPPTIGVLWTPGYWGFVGGTYFWHAGYWGPHVGFYGGLNYGFGYTGVGFFGGGWSGGVFRYNTAVMNVNTAVIRNVYVDRTVANNTIINNRISFNGPGGVTARPNMQEQAAMREQHFPPTSTQFSHQQIASQDRSQLASFNHGHPSTVAMDSVNGRRFNDQGRIANGAASGQVPRGNNEVARRKNAQQQRIAQGVQSGQLTPGETARAERHEQNINRQVNADRRTNGGTLTPAEKKNVNREQNQSSRQIYKEKHNDKVAPK